MNNNQATFNKLETMRLHGMVRAFKSAIESGASHEFTPDELLSHLVDAEWDDRHNRKLKRLISQSKLKYRASFEDINFTLKRNLDKNQLLRLSDCSWIKKNNNIIFTGPTGIGKSFIACALGHQACQYGYRTGYYSCMKLFRFLQFCREDRTYLKEMKRIQKQSLIILDDLGLEPFDTASRLSLLEMLEDRHGDGAVIIISQIPVSKWHETIGDPTFADAICDRIIHNSFRIEMKGESVRKLFSNRDEFDG
jgi:DNA replication protein DnaC